MLISLSVLITIKGVMYSIRGRFAKQSGLLLKENNGYVDQRQLTKFY
jgi:hypothetical protein